MPRPRDRDAAQTRAEILAAARGGFARDGLRGVSLAKIAEQAGIRRPSLLYHFPTKDVLYAAVVSDVFDALRTSLAEAMGAKGSFESRLMATVATFGGFFDERPDVARIVLRELLDEGPGRDTLLHEIAPLLDAVAQFVARDGEALLRRGVNPRAAIMQIASNIVVRAAAGDLRPALWGSHDQDQELTASVLLTRSPQQDSELSR